MSDVEMDVLVARSSDPQGRDEIPPEPEEDIEEVIERIKRRGSWASRFGLPLLTVGICMILFVCYVYAFTGIQEKRTQHAMLDTFTSSAGAVPLSGKVPPDGSPTAVLKIPKLGIDQVVVQGTTATDLTKGPGTLSQAARLGTIGNAVIYGHRTTAGKPFSQIGTLQKGATINVASGLGNFVYKVVGVHEAVPGQLNPASPMKGRWLTLITSNSESFPTGYLYVRAILTSPPGASPPSSTSPAPEYLGLQGDPSAVWPSVIWSSFLLLVLIGTFALYRRFQNYLATAYLLTMPIVVAVALVCFSNLFRLLPGIL